MDFDKLVDTTKTVGRDSNGRFIFAPSRKAPVNYVSRENSGRATVVNGYEGKTGAWVTLHDKVRDVEVVVRPSQVSA